MRFSLRPGTAVLRRDAAHLQVGTSPGMVVRDQPGLYPLLRSLDGTRDVDALRRHVRDAIPDLGVDVTDALAPLLAAGVVIDLSPVPTPHVRVTIAHDAPTTPLAASVTALLAAESISVGPEGDVVVLMSSGEPHRATLADAVRCGVSHLPVVLDGDSVRIGPLVIPGLTPCVECLDRHRATWDPAWPVLVPQFGSTVPTGVAPLIQHVAAGEVVAVCLDLARTGPTRAGRQIVSVGPDRSVRVVASAAFHPSCACAPLLAA